jgi:hypothetical protein
MTTLQGFRIIPPLETYPRLVDFATTGCGKVLLVLVFALGFRITEVSNQTTYEQTVVPPWWLLSAALLALSFWPARRFALIGVFTTSWALMGNKSFGDEALAQLHDIGPIATIPLQLLHALRIILVMLAFAAYLWFVRTSKIAWIKRRAFALFLGLYVIGCWLMTLVATESLSAVIIWPLLAAWGSYLWFFAYALEDVKHKTPSTLVEQIGLFRPFWGSSNTPYPKGIGYLKKVEAKDAAQLAKTQLKGIKLIYWAIVLKCVKTAIKMLLGGTIVWKFNAEIPVSVANVPSLTDVFDAVRGGADVGWTTRWAALLISSLLHVISLAIVGHKVIAACRMAGFNALRNTYRPLQSTTLLDFWNRYYYYFKELLVDFFFFPTFFAVFKKSPRLRVFVATLSAAWLGNFLFHVLRDLSYVRKWGLWGAMVNYRVNFFYCFVLAVSIGISQLRRQKRFAFEHTWLGSRIVSPVIVFVYFSLLNTFDSPTRDTTLREHMAFLLGFFGM